MSLLLKRTLHWVGSALALLGIAFVSLRLHNYSAALDFSRFDTARWSILGLLALTYGMSNLMLAMAWWNLLTQFGAKVSRRWAIKTYGISQLARYVPGNIFHLAGRQAMGMSSGVSGWSLAKSSLWELGLISFCGGIFGLFALPLIIPEISIAVSMISFTTVILISATLFWRFVGLPVALAFGWQVIFLAISGLLFVGLFETLYENPDNRGLHELTLAGAYILAWLIGLVTPGAPAGLGVRELVLLFLLKGFAPEPDIILAIMVGRMVTVVGDVIYFVLSSISLSPR